MNLKDRRSTASRSAMQRAGAKPKSKRPLNQPGRPTAAELERRKDRVLQVATDLFVANGYAATSLVDIAKGAGVATRTLYQHFGDKEALFREVIFARDTSHAIERPAVQPGDTLFTALDRTAHYALDVTFRDQSVGLMRLMIAESQRFPEFMRSTVTSIFARFQRDVAKVFEALEEASLIPAGDHARSAELFTDLVQGTTPIMTYTNWAAERPGQSEIDERIELFIAGRFGTSVASTARTKKAEIVAEEAA